MNSCSLQGMAYIRDRYGVPAKRGMRVQGYLPPRGGYGWQLATDSRITSAGSGRLFLDGGGPYHPTYNLVYLDKDGTVLCDTRATKATPASGALLCSGSGREACEELFPRRWGSDD